MKQGSNGDHSLLHEVSAIAEHHQTCSGSSTKPFDQVFPQHQYRGFLKLGYPKRITMENPTKILDDLGVHGGTPTFGNQHMFSPPKLCILCVNSKDEDRAWAQAGIEGGSSAWRHMADTVPIRGGFCQVVNSVTL